MTRSLFDIALDIETCLGAARARRDAAPASSRGLYTSEMDWATSDELDQLHALQMEMATHPDKTAEAARSRARARRARRRAKRQK